MRIIAGKVRGRHLKTVPGLKTRPTADKVKGAIFNVLMDRVSGAKVLDLFSGTGNLGIEALSRNAEKAVLVEANPTAAKIIRENINLTGLTDQAEIFCMDAFSYLRQKTEETFDLIFLDPPYRQRLVEKALSRLSNPCRLESSGVIIAETSKDEVLNDISYPFEVRKTGEYGDTKIWYLQRIDV